MRKEKTEKMQPHNLEDNIFNPWLIMNPERMERYLTDKAKVKAYITRAIMSNCKAIEKYCDDLKNDEGNGTAGTVYRSPSSSYGMAVQKSDVSDPVVDTLMMAERFHAKRILRLLKINET